VPRLSASEQRSVRHRSGRAPALSPLWRNAITPPAGRSVDWLGRVAELIGAAGAGRVESAARRPDRACDAYMRRRPDTRKAAASKLARFAPRDCSDSSNSAASGRSNRCAKTAPLPRSRSLTPRSWSSSGAGAEGAIAETLARSRRSGSATFSAAERGLSVCGPSRQMPSCLDGWAGGRIEGSEEVTGDGNRRSAER
jgi:hypothetical protein